MSISQEDLIALVSGRVARCPVAYDYGYLAWAGSRPLIANAINQDIAHIIPPYDILVTSIKAVGYHIFDRESGKVRSCMVSQLPGLSTVEGENIFATDDLCTIGHVITQTRGIVSMNLHWSIGTWSQLNERFDLRQIVFHF